MLIVFPSRPGSYQEIDFSFQKEKEIALSLGFEVAHYDLAMKFGGDLDFYNLPDGSTDFIHRGWILKRNEYKHLICSLENLGFNSIVNTEQYNFCYELPTWYRVLKEVTPYSLFFDSSESMDIITKTLKSQFGSDSIMLKDWIKSRKHEWFDACFIPNASDANKINDTIQNFIKLQEIEGGFVFRQFVKFKQLGIHSKSNLPLINEWRIFVWKHNIIQTIPYWEFDYENQNKPNEEWLRAIIKLIPVNFFSIDVAECEDGTWQVIEIGEGGISGVPDENKLIEFYNSLK